MAASNKVGWAQLRVGLMSLVALMILAFLVFLLTGAENPFEEKTFLYTYMSDSAALSGARPWLNGTGRQAWRVGSAETKTTPARSDDAATGGAVSALVPNDSLIIQCGERLGAVLTSAERRRSRPGRRSCARDERTSWRWCNRPCRCWSRCNRFWAGSTKW